MTTRLMLVDDHRMLRETLRRSMLDEGFEVVAEASDGAEAVDLAAEHRPDVVLMDVTMPEMDGVEATRRIVLDQPGTRVIMLTMLSDDGNAVVSKREIEVLQLIADGCSTPEVAEKLFISQKTVKNHLASIYAKLDARDRTQAVLQAVRMGIVRLYS